MENKLYVIFDSKSETYTPPTMNPSRGQALRSFSDAVNAEGSQVSVLSAHPEDFTLFEIGEFNVRTGVVTLYDTKQAVANGVDVKIAA